MPDFNLPAGAILIDNLTLQSVAYLLCRQAPDLLHTNDACFIGRQGGPDKSLALDLLGLSAFIQTVVLHEHVYYVDEYASAWKSILAPFAGRLTEVVKPYPHQGLPDEDPEQVGLDRRILDEVHAKWQVLDKELDPGIVDEIESLATGYDFNYATNRESERARNYSLGIRNPRYRAATSVMIFGALYYELLSRSWEIPLALHPLRGALMWEQFGRDVAAMPSAADIQFQAAQQQVVQQSAIELEGLPQAVCLYAPALTSRVMKDARELFSARPSEFDDVVLSRILRLREHRDAIAYRKHTARLDEVINTGNAAELRDFVKETNAMVEKVALRLGDGTMVKLKVGFGGIASEKQLKLPDWSIKPRNRRHAFLYQTLSGMETIRSLSEWSKKMFSFDPEEMLIKLQTRFDKLQ